MSAFGHFISARSTITMLQQNKRTCACATSPHEFDVRIWRAVSCDLLEDKRDCVTEGGPTSFIRWIIIFCLFFSYYYFFLIFSFSLNFSLPKRRLRSLQLCTTVNQMTRQCSLKCCSPLIKLTKNIHFSSSCLKLTAISFFCFIVLCCSTPHSTQMRKFCQTFCIRSITTIKLNDKPHARHSSDRPNGLNLNLLHNE